MTRANEADASPPPSRPLPPWEARLGESLCARRVVVLGGTGFLGSRLARRAAALGAAVVATGRTTPREEAPPPLGHPPLSHRALSLPASAPESLRDVLAGAELVFNLAGRSGQVASMSDPEADLDVNVRGTLQVLQTLRELGDVRRVVFASSRLVYGRPRATPVTVDHPTAPTSFYGVHKLAAEHYHRLFPEVPSTVLRITNPYGPRPWRDTGATTSDYSIVNWFCELALRGEPLPIYGKGEQLRDYCFVDDVVDALLLAAVEPEAEGAIFNLGSGAGTRFVDMAQAVCDAARTVEPRASLVFREWPREADQVETGGFVADVTALRETLGWEPRTPLAAGLATTIAHYAECAATEGMDSEGRATASSSASSHGDERR